MDIISIIIVGLIAGWLASLIMNKKKKKNAILTYLIVGVIGAFIGGWIFGLLDIAVKGLLGSIISATIGAMCLLYLMKILKI